MRIKSYPYSLSGEVSVDEINASMKRYIEYRNQWDECGKHHKETSFPTNVDIETSSLCNLSCEMCNWGIDLRKSKGNYKDKFEIIKDSYGNMDLEFYKKIINEIARENGYAIKLNWRGEPLINKNIAKMIKYAKEKGILEVLLNTNGTLLNQELSKEIIKAGLDVIIFSFDSMTKELFESIRKGADFVSTLANILNFIKIRDKHKAKTGSPKPLIRVQMVVMDINKHEVDFFKKFFTPIVDLVTTQDYTNRGEENDRLSVFPKSIGRRACPQIWQRLVITWDGKVGMCCRDDVLSNHLGTLDYKNNSIKDIWNGKGLQGIRKQHLTDQLDPIDVCKICTYTESFKWKK